MQLHGENSGKLPRSLLTIWEVATGVVAIQGACEHDILTFSWSCGPGLPECLCLTKVSLVASLHVLYAECASQGPLAL